MPDSEKEQVITIRRMNAKEAWAKKLMTYHSPSYAVEGTDIVVSKRNLSLVIFQVKCATITSLVRQIEITRRHDQGKDAFLKDNIEAAERPEEITRMRAVIDNVMRRAGMGREESNMDKEEVWNLCNNDKQSLHVRLVKKTHIERVASENNDQLE